MSLDAESKKWLIKLLKDGVRFDEPMARHTSLRVGGPAQAFVLPESLEVLKALIKGLWHKQLPYFIMGDGTNLLVKDKGIRGVVIGLKKCLKKITKAGQKENKIIVTAQAGVRMQKLCRFALEKGLSGMNFAVGIPGTVGGGIMMNASTKRGGMENVLNSVTVMFPDGGIRKIDKKHLNFSYRNVSLKTDPEQKTKKRPIIIEGVFGLKPAAKEELKAEAERLIEDRILKQPLDLPNAGCFFKNPESGKTAGELIELAGLKGKSVGGAQVSAKHANFFINRHHASASDFLELMELVQTRVSQMFNVTLKREVKIVGT